MNKSVLIHHIRERWDDLEPQLKIGEEIDKELYDEILWFDMIISQLYDYEFGDDKNE